MLISFKLLSKWPVSVHHPWVNDLNSSKPGLLQMKKHMCVISRNARCFWGAEALDSGSNNGNHLPVSPFYVPANQRSLYLLLFFSSVFFAATPMVALRIYIRVYSCRVLVMKRFTNPALMFYLPTFQRKPGSLSAWFPFQCEGNLLNV